MYRIQKNHNLEGRWAGMPNPKGRVVFQFRFWVLCAVLLVVIFLPIFSKQNGQLASQQGALAELQQQVYEETMRGERLKQQLVNSETDGFREREARQRYGYVMPGVVRFMAEQSQLPSAEQVDTNSVDMPSQENPSQENPSQADSGQGALIEATPAPDKDWGNFGQ